MRAMLIMPRWASAARCRVQVTSNVRHPRIEIQIPRTCASGSVPQVLVCRRESSARRATRAEHPMPKGGAKRREIFFPLAAKRVTSATDWTVQLISHAAKGRRGHPQLQGGRRPRTPGLPRYPGQARCGGIRNMVAALVHLARLPNPSVNLTRNSVPHLPGMARYAHNALPGKRVTLPRAGYLKR
jgi:hypothetical protein